MSEVKTCKDCEHYEFYYGPEKTFDNKDKIMVCRGPTNLNVLFGHIRIGNCPDFTPKKPVVKRNCKTCRLSFHNNNGRSCAEHPDIPKGRCRDGNGLPHWQPIEKSTPIPEDAVRKSAMDFVKAIEEETTTGTDYTEEYERRREQAWHCSQQIINDPPNRKDEEMITCESCEDYTKHEGEEKDERSGITAIMHCNNPDNYEFCSDTVPCKNYKPKITYPKRKEPKMKITKLIFWPIRRYVATCVVIVTAKICIILNPLVFFVAKMVKPEWEAEVPDVLYSDGSLRGGVAAIPWDSGNWEHITVVWFITIAAVALAILALWLYNQFCKKLCKMIGSE